MDQREAAAAWSTAQVAGNGGAPVDATVALVDGRPKVIPSKPGVSFDPDEVTAAFTAALTKPEGEREVAWRRRWRSRRSPPRTRGR